MRKSRAFLLFTVLAVLAAAMPATSDATVGGTVTGTVRNSATGLPLAGACVNVIEATENKTVGTSLPTKSNGVWTLANVPPASNYTAVASHCKGTGIFVGQWYDEQNFQSNATQFAVTSGVTTSAINFSLAPGGDITGKVTDATTKKPVAGILVVAFWTTAFQVATYGVCTPATGKYKLTGAPTSGAYVEFIPNVCGVSSTYSTVWYQNSPSYGSATFVPITANATTSNINQAMH